MSTSSVRFESTTHQYFLPGGRRLPSVTEILKSVGMIPENDFATFEHGAEIHRLTLLLDLGQKVDSTFPELIAWRNFINQYGNDWVLKNVEGPLASESHGFAGTPDRIVWNNRSKRYVVIEIKTGAKADWHRLQTAGYKLLCSLSQSEEQAAPVDRIAVYLKDDGTFSIEYHDLPLQRCYDKELFLAANAIVQWRIKRSLFWNERKEV